MSGLFEFMAADESEQRTASRKAVAVASKRCERFYGFLAQAKTNEDYDARAQIISAEVEEVIDQTADEYGVDPFHLASAIKQADLTFAARKPKMCPYHREVVDVSLGAGDPQAGAVAMAQHAYTENSCRGGFEGKCNFKPEMVSQSFWDARQEAAEQRRLERQQLMEQQAIQEQPEEVFEPIAEEQHLDNVHEFPGSDEPSAVGEGMVEEPMAMAASTREAEALKTVDVDAGGETPSPKIDKSRWTPENVTFVDAEMDGSPHPTVHQDIIEPLEYNLNKDDGRFEQTDAVLEKQDVTEGSELPHSGQGGTFDKGNQASPVTSASDARPKVASGAEQNCPHCGKELDPNDDSDYCEHCGENINREPKQPEIDNGREGAVDPDKNPIREMAEDDFPTEEELTQAISSFEREGAYPPYGSNEHDVMFGNQPPGGEPLPNISPLDGIHDELASRDAIHNDPFPCENCGSYNNEDERAPCPDCGHTPQPYVAPAPVPHDPSDVPF